MLIIERIILKLGNRKNKEMNIHNLTDRSKSLTNTIHVKKEKALVTLYLLFTIKGKFQMLVLPQVGHAIQEDSPEKVSLLDLRPIV